MRRLLHVTTTDISLELLLGPQLRAFREAGYEVHAASAPGPFVPALQADGIVHHPLRHATRSTAPGRDVLTMVELYRLFRQLEPDIVHTHNPKPGVYGRVAARAAGVPLIVNTQHGLYAQPTDPWRRKLPVYIVERVAAALSDVELFQNEEDLATMRRLGVSRHKLHLLGNGIDLERFRPQPELRQQVRDELGARDDEVVVGAVGRLVWEKGYAELLTAAREIRTNRDDVLFVVVGGLDPEKRDGLTAQDVADAQAAGVRFLGHRDDPDRLYQGFDVYVLASHREGFPRSAMEATACGLPVVACDIRGCRQVVHDGVTGLLCRPRDADSLRSAIDQLVLAPARRQQMSEAAVARAVERFDQRHIIDMTLTVYGDTGGRRRPGRADGPIVHVLPTDMRRGAQTYAGELLRAFRTSDVQREHVALTLFGSPAARLRADSLGVRAGRMRRAGFDPRVGRRLRRYLREVGAAVVVAHGGEALKYVAVAGGDRPLVYLKIGAATEAAKRGVRRVWHRRLIRRADAVVGVSAALIEEAAAVFGADRRRLRVIPNGRDDQAYRPAARRGPSARPRLVFVGHMTASKRPEWFVEVVERLRQRGVDLDASMVGDGPALADLGERAAEVGVDVLGARDDVSRLLAAADVFLFTSVPEGEGMPGVLVEAALCALPVVTTAVPGAGDVVVDGITGFVRPPDDLDGLVDACERLLRDPSLRDRLGDAARRHALDRFTLRAGVRMWEELWTDLLAEAGTRRARGRRARS